MIWLLFCAFSLIEVSDGQQHDVLGSSISETVRMGAAVLSRILNPNPGKYFSFAYHKYTEHVKQDQSDQGTRRRDDFALILLRLMGVDSRKITDFALDGIISLVHLMTRVLLKDKEKRRKVRRAPRNFSLFRFVLSQPQVVDLLTQMQDPDLVDLILKEVEEKLKHFREEKVECIKVLICRANPFVRGMQRSLRFFMKRENVTGSGEETCQKVTNEENFCERDEDILWEKATLEDRMYFFTPSLKEVVEYADKCDQLYPNCSY